MSLVTPATHKKYIAETLRMDIAAIRPDIAHRCLVALQDSPLNKAGLLRVYVRTLDNVLLEIDPACRVGLAHQMPRSEAAFCALMAQALEKLRVRAVNSSKTLLKVVKGPVTAHLPADCLKVGTSVGGRPVRLDAFARQLAALGKPVLLAVGAVAKGDPGSRRSLGKTNDYVTDAVCISPFNLSASACVARITAAFELAFGVL